MNNGYESNIDWLRTQEHVWEEYVWSMFMQNKKGLKGSILNQHSINSQLIVG